MSISERIRLEVSRRAPAYSGMAKRRPIAAPPRMAKQYVNFCERLNTCTKLYMYHAPSDATNKSARSDTILQRHGKLLAQKLSRCLCVLIHSCPRGIGIVLCYVNVYC